MFHSGAFTAHRKVRKELTLSPETTSLLLVVVTVSNVLQSETHYYFVWRSCYIGARKRKPAPDARLRKLTDGVAPRTR
jgi:hypothetical protein